MAQEKEIKIELKINIKEFLNRILDYGFKEKSKILQTDIYFDTIDWFLYEHIAALRLRKEEGEYKSFSFKKVFCTPKKRNKYYIEEIEATYPFSNMDVFKKIFTRLNLNYEEQDLSDGDNIISFLRSRKYFDNQVITKSRQIYKYLDKEFVIDEVNKVGVIIELECVRDEPIDFISNILSKNEWSRSVEGTSYKWLRKVKGLDSHVDNFKKFEEKPNWNVWDIEQDFYTKIAS